MDHPLAMPAASCTGLRPVIVQSQTINILRTTSKIQATPLNCEWRPREQCVWVSKWAAQLKTILITKYKIYQVVTSTPHIKFERDPFNIVRVRALTSSGPTDGRGQWRGGGDAKTMISPNTSFGYIIMLRPVSWTFPVSKRELPISQPVWF